MLTEERWRAHELPMRTRKKQIPIYKIIKTRKEETKVEKDKDDDATKVNNNQR